MGTVPMGTGELRMIQSRVVWMFLPVDRSITLSAPQRMAQTSFSTSSSMLEVTAELPMLALILTLKLRQHPQLGRHLQHRGRGRSEEHTSELQAPDHLVCR